MTGERERSLDGGVSRLDPSILVKVQSAGHTFRRLLAKRRCRRVRGLVDHAAGTRPPCAQLKTMSISRAMRVICLRPS